MKRRAIASVIVASTLSMVSTVQPAEASSACATVAEFDRVRVGQSVARVRYIFGGREGWSYNLSTSVQKSWHKCRAGERYAAVFFRDGRVVRKAWTS